MKARHDEGRRPRLFTRPGGQLGLVQPRLLAGVLAALVAWRTRNVGLTLVVGMAALIALEAV